MDLAVTLEEACCDYEHDKESEVLATTTSTADEEEKEERWGGKGQGRMREDKAGGRQLATGE